MSNPILKDLEDEVKATVAVEASAILLITGIADRIDAAVKAAIANGATAEELAPVATEVAALREQNAALAAAVTANNPSA